LIKEWVWVCWHLGQPDLHTYLAYDNFTRAIIRRELNARIRDHNAPLTHG